MNKAVKTFVFISYSLLLLALIVPIFPMFPAIGLDPSWYIGIDNLTSRNFQFGTDVLFTYGPFGNFWYPGILYNPDLYTIQLLVGIAYSLLLSLSTFYVFKDLKTGSFVLVCVSLVVALMFGASISFYLLQILFAALVIKSSDRLGSILSYALILFMAFSVYIKFSHLPTALLLVISADLLIYYKTRKYVLNTLIFLSGTLLFFKMAGQNFENFFNFFLGSLQITSGYSEAMQISGNHKILVLFFLLSAWMFFTLIKELFRQKEVNGIFITFSSLLILFIAYKTGFVRFDGHAIQPFGVLLMVLAFFYGTFPYYERYRSLLLITIFFTIIVHAHYVNQKTFALLNHKFIEYQHKIMALPSVFSSKKQQSMGKRYAEALTNIRRLDPLPPLQGSVDIYPTHISSVIAHDFEYVPRPVFQSYSVYTEQLVEKNKKFLQSNKAPDNILFNIQDIDGRLPSMMEGGTWLEILNRYDISDLLQNYVLLSKREHPLKSFSLESKQTAEYNFDEKIYVPQNMKLVWCSIDIQKSLFGKLFNTLYKSPILYIELTYKNGKKTKNRIVPQIAKSGFILSPQINKKDDFVRFYFDPNLLLPDNEIASMEITGDGLYKQAYKNNFSITYQGIKFAASLQETTPSDRIKQMLFNSGISLGSTSHYEIYKNEDILFSHIPGVVTIDIDDNNTKKQVSFEYALKEEAYTEGNSKGACFSVIAIDKLSETEIFKNCIDPKNKLSDRRVHSFSITIDKKVEKLKFLTLTNKTKDPSWGWAYWKNIIINKKNH